MSDELTVLTPEEASKILKTTPVTVYRWAREGKIPAKKIGHFWRISKQALEDYMEGNLVPVKRQYAIYGRSGSKVTTGEVVSWVTPEEEQRIAEAVKTLAEKAQ